MILKTINIIQLRFHILLFLNLTDLKAIINMQINKLSDIIAKFRIIILNQLYPVPSFQNQIYWGKNSCLN